MRGVKNKFDVVILDPPRSGAGQTVMQQICRQTLQKIIYIACDPAALARDVLIAKKMAGSLKQLWHLICFHRRITLNQWLFWCTNKQFFFPLIGFAY